MAIISKPFVVLTALLGLVVGVPSRRLHGSSGGGDSVDLSLSSTSARITSALAVSQLSSSSPSSSSSSSSPSSSLLLSSSSSSSSSSLDTVDTAAHKPRPFYAIAHRVLTSQSVLDALAVGANALEIDLTAWRHSGWWADHDGLLTSAGDSALAIFTTIAEQRRHGRPIIFVWLDIKNPDHCDAASMPVCSFAALRDLARAILEPAGIHVLYGFYTPDGAAYRQIQADLNAQEAVNLNGRAGTVAEAFARAGPAAVSKRTMAYGYFWLPFQFGDCAETGFYTCTELRQGAASRDAIGLTFGWTSAEGQGDLVRRLLDVGVDGLIFGLKASYFRDRPASRSAFADIKSWVDAHPEKRYLATLADKPW